jgi:putative pyruvate formate lyase activating enzyme
VLEERGAENINIVTGSHAVPSIIKGIAAAKKAGLKIPVLWNSSAYELPETLALLSDTVDVFLPDMKTLSSDIAGNFFNAPDYPVIAAFAIKKMIKMKSLRFNKELLVSGVMVRHLVLPGYTEASREVLRWFANNCKGQALLSLMFQFTPLDMTSMSYPKVEFAAQTPFAKPPAIPGRHGHPWPNNNGSPNRYISQEEYNTVLGWLAEFGIEDGYCQELVPGNTDWLPDFEKENPFPSDLSVPVWHYTL